MLNTPMQVQLKVLKGAKAGQQVSLPVPLCLVGRGKECHLRSSQTAVSQRHCVISVRGDEVVICDLQSLNGTFVNGTKVGEEVVLSGGDQLRIGPLEFEVIIRPPERRKRDDGDAENCSYGTSRGNAHLSTLIVQGTRKGSGTAELDPESAIDADDPTVNDPVVFEPGQAVVVTDGMLKGTTGTVIRRDVVGGYLISLDNVEGPIRARIPSHLLRLA
jgi:pSer/pThr/pTyr-binding forkhead associated (FHA) protein